MKAVKIDLDFEEAQRHIDNLFDVRMYLAGNSLIFPYPDKQLVEFCTEAMKFLIKIKEFGDEITSAIHGNGRS